MPTVKFTYALKRFFPNLKETPIQSDNLPELMDALEQKYPGFRSYILDERGRPRKHVNIFVDNELIHDREALTDQVKEDSEVYIMQALSGG